MPNDFLPSQFFDLEPTTVDTLREKFRSHMEMLKQQDVYEHTLYKKWKEAQDYQRLINRSEVVKAKIWVPTDIRNVEQTEQELRDLRPRICYVNPDTDNRLMDDWLMLRIFCHTMAFEQNPGRFLRFIVYDDVTEKYLGCGSIGSDVISIRVRDQWIGWSFDQRVKSGRLNNSTIATCIMACQPLGYNFLGGKLVAALMTDDPVADAWEQATDHKLVGLTTTSLYGTESMYNSMPWWKKLGATQGKIYLKPDDFVYKEWHHWLKENKKDAYIKATVKEDIVGPITGIKQKIMDMIFQTSGIKASLYTHGFKRGVYYCMRYQNGREYMRGEIPQEELILHPRMKGPEGVYNWWIEKAVNRYKKLHAEQRLKPEVLYYNDLIGVSWEHARDLYLTDVGR